MKCILIGLVLLAAFVAAFIALAWLFTWVALLHTRGELSPKNVARWFITTGRSGKRRLK